MSGVLEVLRSAVWRLMKDRVCPTRVTGKEREPAGNGHGFGEAVGSTLHDIH